MRRPAEPILLPPPQSRRQCPDFLSNSGMEPLHDADHRLNELEIKLSFTEDLLEQLNLAIYRQQQQIDTLALQVVQLRQQSPDSAAAGARNLRDELPPHY
jgi:SlyX protein